LLTEVSCVVVLFLAAFLIGIMKNLPETPNSEKETSRKKIVLYYLVPTFPAFVAMIYGFCMSFVTKSDGYIQFITWGISWILIVLFIVPGLKRMKESQ